MKQRRFISIMLMLALIITMQASVIFASSSKNTDTDVGSVDGTYTFTGDSDWYGYESYLNEQGNTGNIHVWARSYEVTIPNDGRIICELSSSDTPIAMTASITNSAGKNINTWHCGSQSGKMEFSGKSEMLDKGTYTVVFAYERDSYYAMQYINYWEPSQGLPGKKNFYHKLTFKNLTAAEIEQKNAEAAKKAAEEATAAEPANNITGNSGEDVREATNSNSNNSTSVMQAAKKSANTIKVKGKTVTVKYSKLKKKAQTIVRKKAITVSKARGKVTYKKVSGNKKIIINKKTGKITIKKGLKKGTYKLKVKVTAAGNGKYKKSTKTANVKIRIK